MTDGTCTLTETCVVTTPANYTYNVSDSAVKLTHHPDDSRVYEYAGAFVDATHIKGKFTHYYDGGESEAPWEAVKQ
jgi:hypothetical protein